MVLNLSKTISVIKKKNIWNRCSSLLGKDESDLILLTSYNGEDSNMSCINPVFDIRYYVVGKWKDVAWL